MSGSVQLKNVSVFRLIRTFWLFRHQNSPAKTRKTDKTEYLHPKIQFLMQDKNIFLSYTGVWVERVWRMRERDRATIKVQFHLSSANGRVPLLRLSAAFKRYAHDKCISMSIAEICYILIIYYYIY